MIRLRVKEVAEAKGYNMTSLSRKTELAFTTVKKIFRNPYAEISTYTLGKIARVLGVPPGELIEEIPDDQTGSP